MGKPGQAPPFARSEWALGNPNRMIRIPWPGLAGPIQVAGTEWNLAMPAMGAALPDDDLAAVLTYIRQSWGTRTGPDVRGTDWQSVPRKMDICRPLQYESALKSSLPFLVPSPHQLWRLTEFLMNRTEPSAKPTLTPPG